MHNRKIINNTKIMKKLLTYAFALFAMLTVVTSCSDDDNSSKTPQRAYELNPVLRDGHLEKQVAKGVLLDGALDDFLNFWICQYVFEYTSVGPDMKTPVRLTGVISMNKAVFNREVEPKDIMLYNEFTTSKHGERTSEDEYTDVGLFLSKFHNSIAVSADLYGWTLTEDKPQAYCCTEITAQETVDCWDAAMEILKDLKFNVKGLPIHNVGYSSGALGAIAVQKYVDEKRPDIQFERTLVGGGPHDLEAIYKDYLETDTTGYICSLPLMIVAYRETFNMPFKYTDVFQKPLCDNIDSWILSKDNGTWDINDLIGPEKHVSEVLTPEACDINNPITQSILMKFRENSVCGPYQTWQPSKKTKFFVYHSKQDLYITYKVSEELADYLEKKGCQVQRMFENDGNHYPGGLLTFTLEAQLLMGAEKLQEILDNIGDINLSDIGVNY